MWNNRIITELCSSPQLIADWHTLNNKLVNTQEGMTNNSFFKTAYRAGLDFFQVCDTWNTIQSVLLLLTLPPVEPRVGKG